MCNRLLRQGLLSVVFVRKLVGDSLAKPRQPTCLYKLRAASELAAKGKWMHVSSVALSQMREQDLDDIPRR